MFEKYAKGLVGAILAGLASFQTALLSGHVTASEWVGVAIAFFTVFGGVFGAEWFQNQTPPGQKQTVGNETDGTK